VQHLFGYMLPETYFVYWRTSPADVVRKIKQEFDQYYARLDGSDNPPQDLTSAEVVTVASIVEWESYHTPEKPAIAGVYLNRLRIGMKLDADPTVQYGLLETEGQKRRLLRVDYQLDHPYNTYLLRGLPPGPITNPSPSSIRAVLQPEAHKYLYFVATADGTHKFSRTLREHVRASEEYFQAMREQRRQEQ
jgi:UPF0755 protein